MNAKIVSITGCDPRQLQINNLYSTQKRTQSGDIHAYSKLKIISPEEVLMKSQKEEVALGWRDIVCTSP